MLHSHDIFYGKSCGVLIFFQTETALIYDAVHLFAQALHDLDHSQVQIDARKNC